MKVIFSLPLILLGLGISMPAVAQADVMLTVKTDLSCNWKLDGQPMGMIKGLDLNAVLVSPGEHLIEASTIDGVATIHTKVEVGRGENTVAIQLKDQIDLQSKMQAERLREQSGDDAAAKLTWTDPATGLTWAKKDNGSDLDWHEATAYCAKSRLAGFDDWRLPSLEELQGIYDPSVSVRTLFDNTVTYNVHVKGNLKLAGWDWSSSPEDNRPKGPGVTPTAWVFSFGETQQRRQQVFFALTFNYSVRALCVRHSAD
jgi:Protein of unknown function (DUF1566)